MEQNEKTMALPTLSQDVVVRFRLHFLLTIIGAVIAVVIVFINLRNDVVRSLDVVSKQQLILDNNQQEISELKLHMSTVEVKLDSIKELLIRTKQ